MDLSFFPVNKNVSEAWRITEAETEHPTLIPSDAVSYLWGKFFRVLKTEARFNYTEEHK